MFLYIKIDVDNNVTFHRQLRYAKIMLQIFRKAAIVLGTVYLLKIRCKREIYV